MLPDSHHPWGHQGPRTNTLLISLWPGHHCLCQKDPAVFLQHHVTQHSALLLWSDTSNIIPVVSLSLCFHQCPTPIVLRYKEKPCEAPMTSHPYSTVSTSFHARYPTVPNVRCSLTFRFACRQPLSSRSSSDSFRCGLGFHYAMFSHWAQSL